MELQKGGVFLVFTEAFTPHWLQFTKKKASKSIRREEKKGKKLFPQIGDIPHGVESKLLLNYRKIYILDMAKGIYKNPDVKKSDKSTNR